MSKLKTDFSLIKQAIEQKKTKNILLAEAYEISSLDEARAKVTSENLFTKVIDFSIVSSNKINSWMKNDDLKYTFLLNSKEKVEFILKDSHFICKTPKTICKELE